MGRSKISRTSAANSTTEPSPALRLLDVSAQKEAEHRLSALSAELQRRTVELRERTIQLAGIVDSAMDAIVSVDQDQRIVLFNGAAERMFGWTAEQMIGQPIDRLIPVRARAAHRVHVDKFGRARTDNRWMGQPNSISGRRADGTHFPIEASRSKVELDGRVIYTVIMRDITERTKAERELRRSRQVMVDFFEAAPMGLMWVSPDGRVMWANVVELALLDRPVREVMGHSVARLHADPAVIETLLERLGRGETVQNCRLAVKTKGGELRHLLVDANGLWEGKKLEHTRWFSRDITDRLKLEHEILAIAERERERIGHDLHDDLCQQLVAIEYQNETLINEWAARAPAAVAKGRRISAQLRKVIDDARDLAHGLSPHLHFEPDGLMVALKELAERTKRIFKRTCRFKCASRAIIPDDATNIHLYRIAQEAIGNALKHSKATRIELRLEVRDRAVELRIDDNGTGISPASAPGHGAGLRIMRYRAGLIGGALTVTRTANGGTAVVCTVDPVVSTPH